MQQFGASMFHMVVHWNKLGEVESECTLHNFVVLTINMPKIIKVSKNLTKSWQKQFWLVFFWDTLHIMCVSFVSLQLVNFMHFVAEDVF